MDKYLLVKGCAGLGNRILTILSAINYCKKTDRFLLVDWGDGQYGEVNQNVFEMIFDITFEKYLKDNERKNILDTVNKVYPDSFKNRLYEPLYKFYRPINSYIIKNSSPFIRVLDKFSSVWTDSNETNLSELEKLKIIFSKQSFLFGRHLPISLKEDLVIYADYVPFYDFSNLKYLNLNKEIEKDINQFYDENNIKNCIGIHVRNTDMKPTKEVDFLLNYLDENHKQDSIFLTTDNLNIEKLFKDKFENIISTKKAFSPENVALHKWSKNSTDKDLPIKVLKESIYDIYLLSKCKTIYYQGNSSFSILAKELKKDSQSIDWLKF